MAERIVEIEGLTYRYRRATEPALVDLNLTVDAGEVLLVAGPSGCGKSTLIRAINGLIPHAYPGELGGTVRVGGRPTTEQKLREISLVVGTVLQDPAKQIVGATVETELAFGPENLGTPRADIRQRITDVARESGIESLLGRETAALSGGERQLLAMGGILMLRPRLFVVDEPLANLDPATAARLLGTLRGLADNGHAVVIVEHRVEEALELRPDRVLYLDSGQARYLGDVAGFLQIADPGAVKLPFDVIVERLRALGAKGPPGTTPRERAQTPVSEGAPPRLEFQGVRAGYRQGEVLHGIDSRLGAREIVAILGPNGSGKTTLFRTAMKLLELDAGEILMDGASTRDMTTAMLATTFGYVFQSPSQMLFARTVREELAFGPQNLRRDPSLIEGIVDAALRRAGLETLEDIHERPPLTLSFGQQKRLALAIALALEPRTLILDEPNAGQDHSSARTFMSEVMKIPGLESIYLVTHDVDLALTHSDRILLFRAGQIVADGTPAQVIEDEDRWIGCNLRVTSLMRAHARRRRSGSQLLDAEDLASEILREEAAGPESTTGGRPAPTGAGPH